MHRRKDLKQLLDGKLSDEALVLIRSAADYLEAEEFVHEVSQQEVLNQPLLEAALQAFYDAQPVQAKMYGKGGHGSWTHSLSHFVEALWLFRSTEWLMKLHKRAIEEAKKDDDKNCCDRLFYAFPKESQWDDDPAAFSLSPENFAYIFKGVKLSETGLLVKARLEAGKFPTKEAYLRFKMAHAGNFFSEHDRSVQCYMIKPEKLAELEAELVECSVATGDVAEIIRGIYLGQIAAFEAELVDPETPKYRLEDIPKGLALARTFVS